MVVSRPINSMTMTIETKDEPFKSEPLENPVVSGPDANDGKTVPSPPTATPAKPMEQAAPHASLGGRRSQMIVAIFLAACLAIVGSVVTWELHRSNRAALWAAASRPVKNRVLQLEDPSDWPHAPGVVATEEELETPWSSKRFLYRDPILGIDVPAMVVRLPEGGYWGFSLLDPIRDCQLEYVTDLNRLRSYYRFNADHPMVAEPCNLAVFDLLQYSGPQEAEVRGAPVNGIGVRAPIAIEIEQKGEQILATRME